MEAAALLPEKEREQQNGGRKIQSGGPRRTEDESARGRAAPDEGDAIRDEVGRKLGEDLERKIRRR